MLTNNQNVKRIQSRVIVRIWTSQDNKQYPGHNVGHVSVETPNLYMSFWPVPFTEQQIREYHKANILKQQYLKYFMQRDPSYRRNYEEDYQAEGKAAPQIVVCFYSLDIQAMENAFHKLVQNTKGWRLVGSNLFVQQLESIVGNLVMHSGMLESNLAQHSIENCASLVLKVLKAGGITKLVSLPENSSFAYKTSSAVSPDKILDILLPAKQAEMKAYPETMHLTFEGETNLSLPESTQQKILDSDSNQRCLVM